MTLNKKIFKKPTHWITMMAVCSITCLNGCGCGVEGRGEGEGGRTAKSSEETERSKGKENTSNPTSYTEQNLKNMAETRGNQVFELLKKLPPQTVQQKKEDQQTIQQLIGNLSTEEKVIFECYLAAVDLEEEQFIDLFANVANGKDYFGQGLIPMVKEDLSQGIEADDVNNIINNKKNNSLSEEERNGLLFLKELVQKRFITPLTKAAVEQAKN
jgi:hypothetical protein